MIALRASFTRQTKALVAVFAVLAIALTSLVVVAPKADAAYRWHCTVSKTHVRRGGTDAAFCRHGYKHHRGHVFVLRRHKPHYLQLKVFRTGPQGNALFGFPIKPRVPLGRVRVYVQNGNKITSFIIYVKRRLHRHHH